jgi:hypothetical protein
MHFIEEKQRRWRIVRKFQPAVDGAKMNEKAFLHFHKKNRGINNMQSEALI